MTGLLASHYEVEQDLEVEAINLSDTEYYRLPMFCAVVSSDSTSTSSSPAHKVPVSRQSYVYLYSVLFVRNVVQAGANRNLGKCR